jgi:hypothetical protein
MIGIERVVNEIRIRLPRIPQYIAFMILLPVVLFGGFLVDLYRWVYRSIYFRGLRWFDRWFIRSIRMGQLEEDHKGQG